MSCRTFCANQDLLPFSLKVYLPNFTYLLLQITLKRLTPKPSEMMEQFHQHSSLPPVVVPQFGWSWRMGTFLADELSSINVCSPTWIINVTNKWITKTNSPPKITFGSIIFKQLIFTYISLSYHGQWTNYIKCVWTSVFSRQYTIVSFSNLSKSWAPASWNVIEGSMWVSGGPYTIKGWNILLVFEKIVINNIIQNCSKIWKI